MCVCGFCKIVTIQFFVNITPVGHVLCHVCGRHQCAVLFPCTSTCSPAMYIYSECFAMTVDFLTRCLVFIEMEDLLQHFHDPHVMDIKMGTRYVRAPARYTSLHSPARACTCAWAHDWVLPGMKKRCITHSFHYNRTKSIK